jgi:glycosyltransferase involved in cell wall biosynthesis
LDSVKALPLVTIGMPTFNREWSLPQILESMSNLEYDKKRLRICFVDGCSTDGTMKIIESFQKEHGQEYEGIVVRVERSNISKARNIAFREAVGTDYIFFLDSDILCPPDTIKRLLSSFEKDPSVGIVSFPWDQRNSKQKAGLLFGAFATSPGPHYAYKVGNGCNIVSMEAFSKVGFFNERLRVHEDGEYCYRLRKKGFRIICDYSSEGTHLREIKTNPDFYLNLMRDSSEAYWELIAQGSIVHIAKVVSSVVLLCALALLVARPGLPSLSLFAAVLLFGIWLNASKMVLDDGSSVRALWRPIVGCVFTAATVIISVMLILRPVIPHRT